MPEEMLQRVGRSAPPPPLPPPRLRSKAVGLDFYRRNLSGAPKQSAVERLEADKAKYVKSQVALSKQQPLRPAESARTPLLGAAATPLRPTKRTPAQARQEAAQLDLQHLSNLISGVGDGPSPGATAAAAPPRKEERPCPPPQMDCSTPAKVRLRASPAPARTEGPGSPLGTPAVGTVRRVDVVPQAGPLRTPSRPPLFIRQPLRLLHPQLRPVAAHQRQLLVRPAPKPFAVPPEPDRAPSPVAAPSPPPPPSVPLRPPPSPAFTRLSSASSRKRPSLTRSKSDMSDRVSRAGTELERFFNLCGLDPDDLPPLPGSCSDIVSLARFRSVSAPGSEVAGSGGQGDDGDEEEEEEAAAPRVPYGVSVIERNARVIKWLYGLRQAKDAAGRSTNL